MKRLVLIPLAAALLVASPVAAIDYSPATLRAIELLEADKGKEGLAALEAAAARNDVGALDMLALIHIEANQPDVALTQAEAAVRLAPGDAQVLVTRGKAFAALGQLDKARADFEKVLAAGPDASALYERGALLSDSGDHEKALADFRLAFQTDPERYDALAASAFELERLKRPDDALAAWDLLVRLGVTSTTVMSRRGELLAEKGKLEEATASFEAAAKDAPKDADVQVSLGAVWEKRGDYRRAQAAYSTATRVDPKNVYGWWNLARLLAADGRVKPALAAFDRAVALDPVNAALLADRGGALFDAGDERALSDLNAAVRIDPKSTYALNVRGYYFFESDELTKALADFDAALAIDADHDAALASRAQVLLALNRHDRALADVDRAIKIFRAAHYLGIKGEIYSAMGDHLQAVEALDEAIALDPTYAEAWLMRSKSKAELGDTAAAAADRAKALKLNPNLAG